MKGGGIINRLLDKLSVFLVCLIGLSMYDDDVLPVAAAITAASVSSAVQLLSGTFTAWVLIALYAVLCGVFPPFLCALPLIFCDALREKKWYLVLPALAAIAHSDGAIQMQSIITCAGMAIAFIMYQRMAKMEETISRLTLMRDQTAGRNLLLAQENTQLMQAQDNEINLATMRERNRIAREIHDNVGHMLTRALLQSGALIIINKDEKLKEPLEGLKATLDTAMTSMRESVHTLHDDSVDLKKIVDDCVAAAREKFTVNYDYDLGSTVPGKVRLCIAGVVKEGLSNAVKHSGGDSIDLILREHPAFYQLVIKDNGRTGKIMETGIGLKNMRERAADVGGQISFSASEKGFRIFMSVPKENV